MGKELTKSFFNRPTLKVAEDLIGCVLTRKIHGRILRAVITEVEAYDGFSDKASHAHRGKTPRNGIMFEHGGYWYIYLTYGLHWMLNVVTGPKNYPAAVLIRGVVDVSGPARLTKFFKIDKKLNHKQAAKTSGLWIEKGKKIKSKRTPRIGIDFAGPVWSKKKYRFVAVIK